MPRNRIVPEELIEAADRFNKRAVKHGYRCICCAFIPASDKYKAASVSGYNSDKVSFRHMVEQIVEAMNKDLDVPMVLDDDWLPFEYLADNQNINKPEAGS